MTDRVKCPDLPPAAGHLMSPEAAGNRVCAHPGAGLGGSEWPPCSNVTESGLPIHAAGEGFSASLLGR